ncbi:MaoC family dehydratase [Methylopila sp. M107]|uniref:MaoC family dehydratase n=1 Tax=Methylopila sp. M107 TaxID=1101190 RepID=UPI00036C0EFA|nr:MaoC family dehydratase [Methylopila sp. M107]
MQPASEPFSLSDPTALVGRTVGVSDWITIDQSRIDGFARDTGDAQWIHVDVERARRESPFGGPIAHGYLTLAIVGSTIMDILIKPAGVKVAVNYGLDRVRFLSVVKAGARVRNRLVLSAVDEKGGGLLLTTQNSIEIEGEQKPALTAVALVLVSN